MSTLKVKLYIAIPYRSTWKQFVPYKDSWGKSRLHRRERSLKIRPLSVQNCGRRLDRFELQIWS